MQLSETITQLLLRKMLLSGKRSPWQQGHLAGLALWGELWGSMWWESFKDDERARGQSLTSQWLTSAQGELLQELHKPGFLNTNGLCDLPRAWRTRGKDFTVSKLSSKALWLYLLLFEGLFFFFSFSLQKKKKEKKGRVEVLYEAHLWQLAHSFFFFFPENCTVCSWRRITYFGCGEGRLGMQRRGLGTDEPMLTSHS